MKQYQSQCGLFNIHSDSQNTPNQLVKHELHNHNKYELFYLEKGNVLYNIECTDYPIESGDVVIINYHEYHKITVLDQSIYNRYVIQFDEFFINKMSLEFDLFDFFRQKPIGRNNHIAASIVQENNLAYFFHKLNSLSEPSPENDLLAQCTLTELLLQLRQIVFDMPHEIADGKSQDIYKRVIQYINDNLCNELSLDSISKQLFLTKYYLCHIFKKAVGISINEYIITKRVLLANHLISTGVSATEACYRTGFNSYPNFYRAFVRILKLPPSNKNKNKIKTTR